MLTGADTEKIRQCGHNAALDLRHRQELNRAAWEAIGRELVRLGLFEVAPGKFATLEITAAGRAALRERTPITLTKREKPAAK